MRVAIMGAGGIGGFYGARLAQSGHDVTFITRGEHLRAIRSGGLKLVGPAGDARIEPAVLDAFRQLHAAFAQAVERNDHELAITALPTLAATWLVPRLGAFQLAHPQFAVRLDTAVALADLTQGDFDIGIRIGNGRWPGLAADQGHAGRAVAERPGVRDVLRADAAALPLLRPDDQHHQLHRVRQPPGPAEGLRPDPDLPAETRLWAALQQISGGTWGGCIVDVDRVVKRLQG